MFARDSLNPLPSIRPIACSDGQLHEVKYGLSSNSGETLKQLCLSGNGIACLSDYMIDREIARGELVELMADKVLPVEMPFSAVYYSDRAVSTRIRAFIDFLSEHKNSSQGSCQRVLIPFRSQTCRANQAVVAIQCGDRFFIFGIKL